MEEKKGRLARSGLRGVARFCALQKLYEMEFDSDLLNSEKCVTGGEKKERGEIKTSIAQKAEDFDAALLSDSISVKKMDKIFLKRLLEECLSNLEKIDQVIGDNLSKTWSMERLDPVNKCILRLGVTELMCFPETPDNVIFNEYIEIAKAFFETQEVAFINGLLNKVGIKIRNNMAESAEAQNTDLLH